MRAHTITIRAEEPGDREDVARLLQAAFGGDDEAALMERLRAGKELIISLVALQGSAIAGHVAFTHARVLGTEDGTTEVAWLAPLAVAPPEQGRGIGGKLVLAGLETCLTMGFEHAVVLGDPAYYTRFGFSLREAEKLRSNWPKEYLMAHALKSEAPALEGRLVNPDAFASLDQQQ